MKLQAVIRIAFISAGLLMAMQVSADERAVPPDPLRAAIEDLTATFGTRYPQGAEYLARFERIQHELEQATGDQAARLTAELDQLRREALLANPLLSGQPLLFVARHQYRPDHHNTETMFQTGEINTGSFQGPGALKTIDLAHGGEVKTLLELPEGVARDPDVRFDGQKILFSLRRNRQDDYHLHEINADGSGLKQLTFGPGVSDFDPIYLPNGQILFTSTREPKYCMCNRHIMGNLFTMDADGANLQQIGHSTLHEGHSSLLPDGRVLYDRWEYVDRNFGDAQGVWTCNPDGTNHALYWKNCSSPTSPPATIGRGARSRLSTAVWAWMAVRPCSALGRPTPSTWSASATMTPTRG
jgi:WD40-like Beta Propeller Repeat